MQKDPPWPSPWLSSLPAPGGAGQGSERRAGPGAASGQGWDTPHCVSFRQEERLCLQWAAQSRSKVAKDQAPSPLCSIGALF